MPSQAENYTNYYLRSTVATAQRDAEELRKLILEEQGNQQAFIKSLEDYGRSIQDDMQQWVRIGGEADRAERRLLLDRAKAQSQANRQARRAAGRASGVVGTAFDKTVERAAKATAGAGAEAGLSLARIIQKSSTEGGPSPAQYLASQLNAQGKFASALVSGQGFGAEAGGEDDEAKTAYSVGMLRALKEANRGLVSDAVLKDAISLITGVPAAVINEQTLSTMKTARTQQIETRSRGAGARAGDVISDELMRDGFALDDFLPALQAQNLVIREQETLRQIEQARQQRITDTEAEVEQRMLERVDPGRGIEFAGRGLIGAMQYGRQVRQQRQETEQYTQEVNQRSAENQQQEQYLASLSPNVRLLYQATGQGMSSYQKHGNNIPPGVNENLWTIGGQLNTMKKANGFTDNDDLVVKARAMVNQLEGAGDMTPQQRENMLRQALEFYTMQGTGDFPPPPTDQPELTPEEQQQSIADPDAARGIQDNKANDPPEPPPAPEEEAQAAIPTQGRTDRNFGLARRDMDALSQMAMNKAVNQYKQAFQSGVDQQTASLRERGRDVPEAYSEVMSELNLGRPPSGYKQVAEKEERRIKSQINQMIPRLTAMGFNEKFLSGLQNKALEGLPQSALPLEPSAQSQTPDVPMDPQGRLGSIYSRLAKLQAHLTLLTAAEQSSSQNPEDNRTTLQINLPTYLSNNPREALNIRSQEFGEGFVRPVVEQVVERQAPNLVEVPGPGDLEQPLSPILPEFQGFLQEQDAAANAQEFDELLQQLAQRDQAKKTEQLLEQKTNELIAGVQDF